MLLYYFPWLTFAFIIVAHTKRLVIIHPPAGASTIVFASGIFRWAHMGIFLIGVCISTINSVIINNWSDKRQYPTSWPYLKRIKARMVSKGQLDALDASIRSTRYWLRLYMLWCIYIFWNIKHNHFVKHTMYYIILLFSSQIIDKLLSCKRGVYLSLLLCDT